MGTIGGEGKELKSQETEGFTTFLSCHEATIVDWLNCYYAIIVFQLFLAILKK
jgi:hypothetical protein